VGVTLAAAKNEALFCVSLGFANCVRALSVVGRRQNAAGSTAATTMVLSQKEADVQMMLAADVHLGTKNCDFQMERYVWKRRSDGMCALLFLHAKYQSPLLFSLLLIIASTTSGFVF
jgi:hypothetical protein